MSLFNSLTLSLARSSSSPVTNFILQVPANQGDYLLDSAQVDNDRAMAAEEEAGVKPPLQLLQGVPDGVPPLPGVEENPPPLGADPVYLAYLNDPAFVPLPKCYTF